MSLEGLQRNRCVGVRCVPVGSKRKGLSLSGAPHRTVLSVSDHDGPCCNEGDLRDYSQTTIWPPN